MNKLIQLLGLSSLLFSSVVFGGDIKLPEKLPEVAVTETGQLGTREDGIGLAPGSRVADFELSDHMGKTVRFASLKSEGPLLVVFYRGGWCPYCNRQIHQLTQAWPEFQKRDITPVLISVDKPDGAAIAKRTYEIPFPVLSDPDLVAHDLFQVARKLDDALLPKYKQYGIDIELWSGKDHHKFAVASAFIVDKNGSVVWAHSSLDYKTRPSVEQLLRVIDLHAGVLGQ